MEELIRIFTSLEFASPLYFWIGGAAILFWIFFPFFRKKRLLRFETGYWLKRIPELRSKKLRVLPILIVITSILISAALANPQIIEKRDIPLYGKPVMVVMDISGSMSVSVGGGEEKVSNFDRAKAVYDDIVKRDLGASIGLLLYSSQSYIARDFATELKLLEGVLEDREEIEEISSGTMTAEALSKARRFFTQELQAKDKSLILISDLQDVLKEVGQEIKKSLEEDIKVYVIVVAEKPEDATKKILEFKNEMVNEEVRMVYFQDQEGINQICQEIRQMESSFTGQAEILSQKSLTPYLLPLILGLVILCIVLSETIFRKIL